MNVPYKHYRTGSDSYDYLYSDCFADIGALPDDETQKNIDYKKRSDKSYKRSKKSKKTL